MPVQGHQLRNTMFKPLLRGKCLIAGNISTILETTNGEESLKIGANKVIVVKTVLTHLNNALIIRGTDDLVYHVLRNERVKPGNMVILELTELRNVFVTRTWRVSDNSSGVLSAELDEQQ